MLFLLRILYALSVLRIVVAHNYTLHHRFLPIPPIGSIPAFQPRGIVSLPEDGLGSASFAELHGGEISDDGNGWYQVTFQTGDEEDDWPLSSIKSVSIQALKDDAHLNVLDHESSEQTTNTTRQCHIASTSHVHLTIHMTSSQPSAISLHSSSDSCPPKSVTTSLSPLEIIIKHPTKPQR